MSEPARDAVYRGHHVALGLRIGFEARNIPQGTDGQDGRRPCAVVLRGEILSTYLLQVLVDVIRMDGVTFAVGADVLEQHLARELFASPDHPRHAAVRDPHLDLASALASEKKSHRRPTDGHVAVAQGGETE